MWHPEFLVPLFATAAGGPQDMARSKAWFNLPQMLAGPSNFFGPVRRFGFQSVLDCNPPRLPCIENHR
jgi:hypothetical protein